jgi:hypothetical protein
MAARRAAPRLVLVRAGAADTDMVRLRAARAEFVVVAGTVVGTAAIPAGFQ